MQDLTVNIEGTSLQIKEFNGQRVVTFKDIDNAHERPEGTARKRFNDNKKRFIEGVDYYELNQPDEIRTLGIERPQGGTPQKVVLVTESGYLMIAKSLTDDLSWDVQRSLVDNYFRFKEQIIQSKPKRPRLKPKDLAVKQHMNIAEIMIEKIGLDPGIAYSVAIDEAEKESGCNLLAYEKLLPGADHPTGMYNATDLGKKVRPDSPVSAIVINKTLKALGLQVKEKDWVITDAGKEYGEMMPYTASFDNGSSHSDYRPLWNEKAVELLKEYYKEEGDK